MSLYHRAKKGQRGQGMTEYIIIVALVAVAAIAVVSLFGKKIKDKFIGANTTIEKVGTGSDENAGGGYK
jgi:Flp pilus assembly pilin Flp